jgi:archaellum component FlaC
MIKLLDLLKEAVEVPAWLKGKLEDVHTKPGQGSIFAKSVDDILKIAQDAIGKEQNIDQIANSTGTLTISSPGIGYNLVLPIEKAKQLPGAQESETEKVEGPNRIKVPAITTTAPISQFKTDELTVIVRPKKDESGAVIPNEYIVLSAFPGDPTIPRASEWDGKYAVIIPGGKEEVERMQELAGIAAEKLDPVGQEDEDINNDNKVNKTDKYLAKRRKAIAANLKEGDHEVAMAVSSLEEIAKAIIELRQKLGNTERNIPGWIQDHIAKAENYIEQAAQGFHELKQEVSEGLQYFHNGSEMNQIINYDDSNITDDLESFGQGSMDGQDFKPGKTYNIGGQEYKVEPQGDEFKLVLAESIEKIVNEALKNFAKRNNE